MAVSNSTTVTTIYGNLAGGLAPPAADLATYTALMNNAGWTAAMVTASIEAEPFIQNVVNPIIREYQAAFGRVPDQGGLSFWIKQFAPNGPSGAINASALANINTIFSGAAEFTLRYGSTWTPTTLITPTNGAALVTALYTNVLGRSPDAAGLSYWLNAKVTVAQLLQSFAQSAEFITDSNAPIGVFENLEAAGTPPTAGSLLGLVPPVITNIALTTGIDTLSISANNTSVVGTFNGNAGAPSTYTAGDSITAANGLTGVALTLSDQGTGGVGNLSGVAATVSGVPTLSVFSGESLNVNTVTSIAGFTGLTQLNATTSSSGTNGDDRFTVGATTNVTITDLGTNNGGTTGVYILGGQNVAMTESGAASGIYIGGSTATNPTGTVTVNVTGTSGSTEVFINGGTTVTVNSSQTGEIEIGNNFAPSGAVAVTSTNDATIAILGGASATVTETANMAAGHFFSNDVYVQGVTGAVTVADTAISGDTIHIYNGASAAVTTTGGDRIYIGQTAAISGNVTVTDTFAGPEDTDIEVKAVGSVSITTARNSGFIEVGTFGTPANNPTGTVTVVDATGTNYGTAFTEVYTNGSTAVSITGGSFVLVTDEAATQALKTVSVTGAAGGGSFVSMTGNAITTVNLSSSKAAVTINNATALNSVTLNVTGEGSSSTSAAITDNTATTISLAATGASNWVSLADSVAVGATALNISNTGTGTLWLTAGGNFGGAAAEAVTVSGTGAVNLAALGTNGSVKSITTTDTGGVTVTINDGVTFNGGTTGNNVVTDHNGNGTGLTSVVNGGTGGNNILIMDSAAANYNAAPGLGITNFSTLEVSGAATGAYDATVFTALIDNAGGAVTFNNVQAGTPITLMSNQNVQVDTPAGVTALTFNVGIAGSSIVAPTAYTHTVTVNTVNPGVTTLNLAPVLQYGLTTTASPETINIVDNTAVSNAPVSTINVTGSGALTVGYATPTNVASALTTINASGSSASVTTGSTGSGTSAVVGVYGSTTGLTITGGSGKLTAVGSGAQGIGSTVGGETSTNYIGATDTFTSGSGGASITLGYAQTTTVNLGASAAKSDTVTVGHLVISGGTPLINATVNGFTVSASSTTADKLSFYTGKVLNVNAADLATTLLATNATVLGTTSYGGSDTYTVSNGMIIFSGPDAFGQLVQDAAGIVGAAGAYKVAAFTSGGNTYVVDSEDANTGVFGYVSLAGVTATEFGGATAATGSVISNMTSMTAGFTGATVTTATSGTGATTLNDSGYIVQAITGTGTGAVTVNNLAPSAIVNDGATVGFNLTTTQLGTAGSESLTLNITGAQVMPVLTVTGDNALTIAPTAASTVTSLVDPGNTLASLSIGGTAAFTLGGFTDTALTKISVSDTAQVILGSSGTPLSKAGLAVALSSSTVTHYTQAHEVYLSGATNTVTAADDSSGLVISATGAGSTVTLSAQASNVVGTGQHITVGATGTVTLAQGTAAAAGVAANDGGGNADIYVGTNSVITLGTSHTGTANDSGSFISVVGDVTGANSAGTYAMTTINNAVDNNATEIQFTNTGPTQHPVSGGGLVNVAVATSLANALDVAAHYISSFGSSGQDAGWFQYGGNTYVLEHIGGSEAAMSATDSLVKLTGIVDLGSFHAAGGGSYIL